MIVSEIEEPGGCWRGGGDELERRRLLKFGMRLRLRLKTANERVAAERDWPDVTGGAQGYSGEEMSLHVTRARSVDGEGRRFGNQVEC
jgi:hypothetical protein